MKNVYKIMIATVLLTVMFFTAVNGNAQVFTKSSRTESYRLPMLPNVNTFFKRADKSILSIQKQDFFINLRDNVKIDASKFYPTEPNPYLPDGYPVVIMVHGYGDRKETLEHFASAQASYGYVVYTFSVRGQGNSEGKSNLISRTEAQDLIEIVNYIKNDNINTGSDSSKVLIMGGSQGGTLPYMAASMGMSVKAIISALASPDFGTSWIENGSIKMSLLWTIEYTPDSVQYTPLVDRMSDWIYSNDRDKWDSLKYWMPKDRDFSNIISNNTVPMVLENSWQDMFFNAYGNITGIPVMNAPSRYYFGAVMGHGGDISPTEDEWHMNFFNEWFFYWLFGIENNILTRPKYHFAYTSFPEVNNMWSFVHDSSSVWPPEGMNNFRLYFNTNKKLKTTVNKTQTQNNTLKNIIKNKYTMTQIVDDEFKGSRFKKNFIKDSIIYDSDPLTSNVSMLGTPVMNLDYLSNAAVSQFNFQIFEVNSSGYAKFVTSINYTDRNNTTLNVRKKVTVTGNSHGHIFKTGSKIRIVMTNLDQRWKFPFLATNPFVLPVMTNFTNKLYLSAFSYIDIPVKGTSPSSSPISTENPESSDYSLVQNYPNPFNPSTTISYNLPEGFTGLVNIRIYDITGRQIDELVNTNMTGGKYIVTWNASKYSSGVYFYKMTAGNFTDIKKMFLIK